MARSVSLRWLLLAAAALSCIPGYSPREDQLNDAPRNDYSSSLDIAAQSPPEAQHHPIDLTGLWAGHYGQLGEETIRIEQRGEVVVGTKVTGDLYVPAGAITFRARVNGLVGSGEIQVADFGFTNPRMIPGSLRVLSRDSIVIVHDGETLLALRRLHTPAPKPGAVAKVAASKRPAHAETRADVVARVSESVVFVFTETGSGSGLSIKSGTVGTIVVTNLHVVAGAKAIGVRSVDGRTFGVTDVWSYDETRDLALLSIEGPIPGLKVAKAPARPGDDVIVVGYPQGTNLGVETPTVTTGIVSAIRHDGSIQFDAAVSEGSSGGAVTNGAGEVWAITRSTLIEARSISFGIPAKEVLTLLEHPRRIDVSTFGRLTLEQKRTRPL